MFRPALPGFSAEPGGGSGGPPVTREGQAIPEPSPTNKGNVEGEQTAGSPSIPGHTR